jgi:glutathione S-transferase
MYQLFIANKNYSSWSLRPWVLMRELTIAFDEHMNPFAGVNNFEQFRKFSPSGRVPCLQDGATVVWDSLAIVEYLAERHAGVWPKDGTARAWARCAAAEMHSSFGTLRGTCSMSCGVRVRLNEYSDALRKDVARIDELWSEGLQRHGGHFLAGREFTAVDAFFAPVVFRVQTYGLRLSAPSQAYADRLLGLPSMRAWYQAAMAEPWRDDDHDVEISRAGAITADLRRQ